MRNAATRPSVLTPAAAGAASAAGAARFAITPAARSATGAEATAAGATFSCFAGGTLAGGAPGTGTARGEEFIPKLIHSLSMKTLSVSLEKPTLNDVFLKLTGRAIRDDVLTDDRAVTREFVRSHRRAQR